MNMTKIIPFIACLLLAGCVSQRATPVPSPDTNAVDMMSAEQAIPILTQELLNALPGDVEVWRRYLSDRITYVSEAGVIASKAELLEAFVPFPPGISGSLLVKNPRITELGDIAISVFDGDEKQTIYDQQIEVKYRTTHTWRRENGRWRLIAAQNLVLAKDPPPLPIDRRRMADYPGIYELSGKRRYRVEQRGEDLVGGPENGELIRLIPVGDNVFVDSGSNLGILRIFVRGEDGAIQRMVQRRKFADLDWVKVSTAGTK
jgi:hypothetical protein